jgi:hypothetical protein
MSNQETYDLADLVDRLEKAVSTMRESTAFQDGQIMALRDALSDAHKTIEFMERQYDDVARERNRLLHELHVLGTRTLEEALL